jgi:hypothetical protein
MQRVGSVFVMLVGVALIAGPVLEPFGMACAALLVRGAVVEEALSSGRSYTSSYASHVTHNQLSVQSSNT